MKTGEVVTEQFLNCRFDQYGIVAQSVHGLGVLKEGEYSVPNQVDCRFMSGDKQKEDHCQQLVSTQFIPRFFRSYQRGSQILLRISPARFEESSQIPEKHPDVGITRKVGLGELSETTALDHL